MANKIHEDSIHQRLKRFNEKYNKSVSHMAYSRRVEKWMTDEEIFADNIRLWGNRYWDNTFKERYRTAVKQWYKYSYQKFRIDLYKQWEK